MVMTLESRKLCLGIVGDFGIRAILLEIYFLETSLICGCEVHLEGICVFIQIVI